VTIIGIDVSIEGFLVQARDRSNGQLIGNFEAVPDEVNVIDCFGEDTQVIAYFAFRCI